MHVGGLMRLDLIQASVQTIYITVWASLSISLHMGKIGNADELRQNHFGSRLQVKPFPSVLGLRNFTVDLVFCCFSIYHGLP